MKRAALFLALLSLVGGCRILSEEVACRRSRDCPDALPLCDAPLDGGVGVCVPAPDGGTTPDGGALDGGA